MKEEVINFLKKSGKQNYANFVININYYKDNLEKENTKFREILIETITILNSSKSDSQKIKSIKGFFD